MQNPILVKKLSIKGLSSQPFGNSKEQSLFPPRQSLNHSYKESIPLDTIIKNKHPLVPSLGSKMQPAIFKVAKDNNSGHSPGAALFPKDIQSLSEYRVHEDKRAKGVATAQMPYWFIEGDKKFVAVLKKKVRNLYAHFSSLIRVLKRLGL